MGIRISAINMIARPFLAVIYHLLISISRSSEASQISSSQFITKEVLLQFRGAFQQSSKNCLAMNFVSRNDYDRCILNNKYPTDGFHDFSDKLSLESQVTDQHESRRCWIFAGLNVIRNHFSKQHGLVDFEFSQSYVLWYDKFEKANFFLEKIIESSGMPIDSRLLQRLLRKPVDDAGQWHMFVNIIEKYGIVPKEAFQESFHSNNSKKMNYFLSSKLREFASILRNHCSAGRSDVFIRSEKEKMLEQVYRILCISLGEPPLKFDWIFNDREKIRHVYLNQSPVEFYKNIVDYSITDTISLINDPRHEMNRMFTIDHYGNMVEGRSFTYVNLPIDQLKKYAIKSIKSDRPVWFGSDALKYVNEPLGLMDASLVDYELTFGVNLELNKADRLRYGDSAITHAMTITGVDLADNKPIKWRVENSWGALVGDRGYFSMSDGWFDEFTYQIVVHKCELDRDIINILDQSPNTLPLWDPIAALS